MIMARNPKVVGIKLRVQSLGFRVMVGKKAGVMCFSISHLVHSAHLMLAFVSSLSALSQKCERSIWGLGLWV